MYHYKHAKNQNIRSIHSRDTIYFRVPWPKRPRLFLTAPIQKLLKKLLSFLNLYQHAKNSSNLSIHSWSIRAQFWLSPPKRVTLIFPDFVAACKKSTQFINLVLRYSQFKSFMVTPILTKSLYFASKCKKSGYFIVLF